MRNFFVGLLVLTAVGLLAYLNAINKTKTPSEIIKLYSDCPLEKKTCSVSMQDNQEVIFKLEPEGLPVMEPLFLNIYGLSKTQQNLKISFEGQDMNMGLHFMLPIENDIEPLDAVYRFKGMIPVCVIDSKMVWLLNAEFSYDNKLHQVQFQLKTLP